YNLACLNCRSGRKAKAYDWLDKAIAAGFNDATQLAGDADFESIRNKARFKRILQGLRGEAASTSPAPAAPPVVTESDGILLSAPEGLNGDRAAPLIIALHGYDRNAASMLAKWKQAAADAGAVLAVPEGPIHISAGAYQWKDATATAQAVTACIDRAKRQYTIDETRVVLAGVCQGGAMACRIVASDPKQFCGVILTATEFDPRWKDVLAPADLGGRRIFIMVGEKDSRRVVKSADLGRRMFENAGAEVNVRRYPHTGHGFPRDAEEGQAPALAFVLGL
ncbi:MAG: dienelactone hydrolase family protein, partial [Phycisphaerae bacterium]